MKSESTRLKDFKNGEIPQDLYLSLCFESNQPDVCISRIVQVLELVFKHDPKSWPDDHYWRESLPDWLLKTFRVYSKSELTSILATKSRWPDLDWTFGSWIDRMKNRCWRWWSLERQVNLTTLYLSVDGLPCSIKALEHLIVAAGGSSLTFR
ncbi:MAG: hypothetical protein H6650_05160 [Ardenticatenales bacterium]|nr:hypothetical protein [Ardenticatenales bacterium]